MDALHKVAIAHGLNLESVPEWTRWIAQDADGVWWAYEAEPNEGDIAWYENEVGRYQRLGQTSANPTWRNCLYAVRT